MCPLRIQRLRRKLGYDRRTAGAPRARNKPVCAGIVQSRRSARSSRLDGCAGGARSLEVRILAAALAAQTTMKIEVAFRKITAALNQAGIQYMLVGSFASTYHGAARSTQNIDLIIEATPAAAARICAETAQRGILCRLGCRCRSSCAALFVQRD